MIKRKTEVKNEGGDQYVLIDDVKIAKRGRIGTETWILLEPGWEVHDLSDGITVIVPVQSKSG
jgi:hypothetical protein